MIALPVDKTSTGFHATTGGNMAKKIIKQQFDAENDGFHGSWYPCPNTDTNCAMIIMLGDSSDDKLATCGAKWLHKQGFHALAMSPASKDYGHHNYPLERFGKAIAFLKTQGCDKIGIIGASTTGMLALVAASYYNEISLTIAISPSDFIMEGFYQDGLDGMRERPGNNESTVTWQGKPLPYLPYAYRHPEYWQRIKEESRATGNMIASRRMFDESERRHPLQEKEKIKVENIRGRIVCIGAKDDALWDTCKYIERMKQRLAEHPHVNQFEAWIYERGTHFLFPESLLRMISPVGAGLFVGGFFKAGRLYPKECLATRVNLDERLLNLLGQWKATSKV